MTLAHRRLDVVAHRLHARGGDLADDDVVEAVEHQPGQSIGFAVRQPEEGPVVERATQRLRDLQPMDEQRLARRENQDRGRVSARRSANAD